MMIKECGTCGAKCKSITVNHGSYSEPDLENVSTCCNGTICIVSAGDSHKQLDLFEVIKC